MRKSKCKHAATMRFMPDLGMHCRLGRCSVCGTWFSLGYADEPTVDVRAATIGSAAEARVIVTVSHAEMSGMAGCQRWYDPTHECWAWDAGWLARVIEEHDAVQRDEGPADETLVECCPRKQWGDGEHDADCVDVQPTVSIDSDGSVAVQINGIDSQDISPMFTPDEADDLADGLHLGSDAARQAQQDGHVGPAVVVELVVGDDPDDARSPDLEHGIDCPCDHQPSDVGPCDGCSCSDYDATRPIDPHPDTLAQPERSWPPNTGCEPDGDSKPDGEP